MGLLTRGGVYEIKNVGDGLRVNVAGSNLGNGANVLSWPTGGTAVGGNDSWVAIPVADNAYKFRTQIAGNSGQILDENREKSISNLWTDHDGKNQEWRVEPVAFQIQNAYSKRVLQAGVQGATIGTVAENANDRNTWWVLNNA